MEVETYGLNTDGLINIYRFQAIYRILKIIVIIAINVLKHDLFIVIAVLIFMAVMQTESYYFDVLELSGNETHKIIIIMIILFLGYSIICLFLPIRSSA